MGRLNLSFYGTRDAAMNWPDEFTSTLEKHGFNKGKASTCNFFQPSRKISVTVHGDDFTPIGTKTHLQWFESILNQAYECKHQWMGPDSGEEKSIRILNRVPHGFLKPSPTKPIRDTSKSSLSNSSSLRQNL